MSAQSMVEGMFLNMRQLEDSIGRLQEDLDQKETDMKNLEIVATDMAMREQDLLLGLENSRSVVLHQYEKVNKKRDTIDLLKDKIATLQAELAKEESILAPMERTILMLEQKVADKEQRLIDHREELASFEAMRQAILQERDGLSRDLENSNSELESLKVIQGLAHGEDLL
jgi:chromosome segregation ATPase